MHIIRRYPPICIGNYIHSVITSHSRSQKQAIICEIFDFNKVKMAVLEDEKIKEMIELCRKTLDKSYCVYSKFPVASVIVTDCDKVFTGCNVENSSYGLCICAERTAAVKAVSEGYRKFKACFVTTNSDRIILPCGACRQFLSEFGYGMTLYLIARDGKYEIKQLSEALPFVFNKDELASGVLKD